jgi:predicted ABC-type transport system involved in lysophospholipase L1 biosynthesis ATPase subunit
VLDIFSRLNSEGRTIVLITHEHDVAERCKRIVQLSDGRMIEDRRLAAIDAAPPGYDVAVR